MNREVLDCFYEEGDPQDTPPAVVAADCCRREYILWLLLSLILNYSLMIGLLQSYQVIIPIR